MEAAIVDPGGDLDRLLAAVKRRSLNLKAFWLTPGPHRSRRRYAELVKRLSLPIIGPHPGDQFWIEGLPEQSAMFGFPPAGHFRPTRWLADGDTVQMGYCELAVRHCPAPHAQPRGVSFTASKARLCR